jgi:hypothetical protein
MLVSLDEESQEESEVEEACSSASSGEYSDTDLDDGMVFNFEPLNVRVQVSHLQAC